MNLETGWPQVTERRREDMGVIPWGVWWTVGGRRGTMGVWSTGRRQHASASLAASSSVPEEMPPEESDHVVEGGLFFGDSAAIRDAHVPHSVADEEFNVATVPASASGGSDCI